MSEQPERKARITPVTAVLGAMSLAGYAFAAVGLPSRGTAGDVWGFLALFGSLFVLYFMMVHQSRRGASSPPRLRHLLLWAVLFRLALLPAGLPRETWLEDLGSDLRSTEVAYRSFLLYDNDVWRYLWDGHVFAAGLDPYSRSPAEFEELADDEDATALALFEQELWQDVFDRVTYETYRTVYPPAAQWLFRIHHALAPGSVFVWKSILVLFDLGTCLLLAEILRRRGGRVENVVIYAWNPLVLKEIAGSGHLDAMMIFFLVGSVFLFERRRDGTALVAYGLAVLSKLTPLLLLVLMLRRAQRRRWWLLAGTLAAGALPFLGSLAEMVGGVLAFSREWVFNPGPWLFALGVSERILGLSGRTLPDLLALAVTLSLVAWTARRDDGGFERLISGVFLVLGGYLVTSATIMPWYLLWVLPFAAMRPAEPRTDELRPEVSAWLALTALSLLSYLIYIDQIEHRWWLWLEYLGCAGVLAGALWRRRRLQVSS